MRSTAPGFPASLQDALHCAAASGGRGVGRVKGSGLGEGQRVGGRGVGWHGMYVDVHMQVPLVCTLARTRTRGQLLPAP